MDTHEFARLDDTVDFDSRHGDSAPARGRSSARIAATVTAVGLAGSAGMLLLLDWVLAHRLDGIVFWASLAILVQVALLDLGRQRRRPHRPSRPLPEHV